MTDPIKTTHFEQLGGEAGIRRLVDRFYDLMDTASEAKNVRALHAASLKQSREKLIMFLTGWTGGPPVYVEKVGPPNVAHATLAFRDQSARKQGVVVVHGSGARRAADCCRTARIPAQEIS